MNVMQNLAKQDPRDTSFRAFQLPTDHPRVVRSEERRVGKEC